MFLLNKYRQFRPEGVFFVVSMLLSKCRRHGSETAALCSFPVAHNFLGGSHTGAIRNTQLAIRNAQLAISNTQLAISNPQLSIRNAQLAIRNAQLAISNTQRATSN